MKKYLSVILSLILVISAISPLTVFAAPEDDYSIADIDSTSIRISRYNGSDTTVLVPSKLNEKDVTEIGQMAFYFTDCMNVTTQAPLTVIANDAFGSCSNLRFVTLNEGLKTIGESAFETCMMLSSIIIPASVESIGPRAFAKDESLGTITVAEGNQHYVTDGVALLDINRTVLMQFPAAKNIQSYTVPYTVTTINAYSFAVAKFVKAVSIPVSVTNIEANAFGNSNSSITDIYYAGTSDQWNAITKGGNNNVLTNATIHYGEYEECDEHTWNAGVKTKDPTCTAKGETTYTCIICGATDVKDNIDSLGHNFGEWIETTAPTCTAKGEETRYCSRCPETETQEVDALGHNFGEWVETTAPTCTAKGEETRYCSRCPETETQEVDALGHNFGEWVETTAPTCTAKGENTRYCSRCPETETQEVDALGHDFGEWTVTKPATCTEDGEETRYCSRCPETETRVIDSAGAHQWNDGEVTTEPTCTVDGVKTFTCTVCGDTRTEPVKATGEHTAVTDKAVPATFKKTGLTKGSHCSVCGEVLIAQKTVAKLGAPKVVKLTMGKKGLTVKWKTVKKVHGYKIQISKSKKFKKGKAKTFTVKNQKQAKRTIKRYKKGKYYVRIRAYKMISGKKQYSKWSKAKSISK